MALRLILVGIVAGLGLTLPSRREVQQWGRSAEGWVNARLADWDTQMPIDEAAFVFVADAAEPVAAEPAKPDVSDHEFDTVVEEIAVGFAQDVAPVAPEQPEVVVALAEAPVPVPVEAPLAEPVEAPESLAIAAPVEPAALEPLAPVFADAEFDAVVTEMAGSFAADLSPRPVPATIDQEFAGVVDAMAAEFADDATRLAGTAAQPLAPTFEPMDISEDLYSGEAYALNELAEGIIAEDSTAEPEPSGGGDRLTNAVRLTREAVFAWASLLHGAVVTISR